MTVHQSAVAVIAPDGNRVVGLSMAAPLDELIATRRADIHDPRIVYEPNVRTDGDWPFRFDRIYVVGRKRWRCYRPDDLPLKHWRM